MQAYVKSSLQVQSSSVKQGQRAKLFELLTVTPATRPTRSLLRVMQPASLNVVEFNVQEVSVQNPPSTLHSGWVDEFTTLGDRHNLAPLPLPPLPPAIGTWRVVLVRHGQSTWNAEGRIQGSSDYSVLTPKGMHQAQAAHDALNREQFHNMFYSPLARAAATAKVVWGARTGQTQALPSLREIDLYDFQGLVKAEGKARFGEQYQAWQCRPEDFELNGHAPVRELWYRASLAWRQILQGTPITGGADADVAVVPLDTSSSAAAAAAVPPSMASGCTHTLVVAHNAVNQALLCTALGLPPSFFRRLQQRNAAFSILHLHPQPAGRDVQPMVTLECLNQSPSSPLRSDEKMWAMVVLIAASADKSVQQRAAQSLAALQVDTLLTSTASAAVDLAGLISYGQLAAGLAQPAIISTQDLDSEGGTQAAEGAWSLMLQVAAGSHRGSNTNLCPVTLVGGSADVHLGRHSTGAASQPRQTTVAVVAPAEHVARLLECSLGVQQLAGDATSRRALRTDPGGTSVLQFAGNPLDTQCELQCINNVAHLTM